MKTVEGLLADGLLQQAIELARHHFPDAGNMVVLSARQASLQKQIHAGTITNEDANLERNRIGEALLAMIEEVRNPT